jgi:hypothetical protein
MNMENQKFKGPYWMRPPLPDSDRVKYLSNEIILERLKNGEKILFAPDGWMKSAPRINFQKDGRLVAIRRCTFESLRNKNIIVCVSEREWSSRLLCYLAP